MRTTSTTLAAALLLLGCGSDTGDFSGGAPGTLTVTVTDASGGAPLVGAVAAIEQGGIYVDNPDTSVGNPSYQFGGMTDAQGRLVVELPGGTVGVHVFANGYRYAPKRVDVDGDTEATIEAEANLNADRAPSVSGSSLEPSTVAPGGSVVASTTATAVDAAQDPLSEETAIILPDASWSALLDPPSPGDQGVAYPDGDYTLTITAPSTPGTYVYSFVTTTEHCITSDREDVTLTVQ